MASPVPNRKETTSRRQADTVVTTSIGDPSSDQLPNELACEVGATIDAR